MTVYVVHKIFLYSDLLHFYPTPQYYSISEYILGQQGEMEIMLSVFRENGTDGVFNYFDNIIGVITS